MKKQLFQSKHFTILYLFASILSLNSYGQVIRLDATAESNNVTIENGAIYEQTLTLTNTGNASVDWSLKGITIGDAVSFEKLEGTDENLIENQDYINDNIIFTRGEDGNIYNIAKESSFDRYSSPIGTKWQSGKSNERYLGSYYPLRQATGSCGPCLLNNTYSMYLEYENRYFDFDFTSFSQGGEGFAYTRREIATWATLSETSGSIGVSNNVGLTLNINTEGVSSGEYLLNVEFESNQNINDNNIIIPIVVTISNDDLTSNPVLNVSNDDFSISANVGTTSSFFVEVGNSGTEPLIISGITIDASEEFEIIDLPDTLPVGSFELVEVLFTPTEVESKEVEFVIESNDLASPKIISVFSYGNIAPSLIIDQTPIVVDLEYGEETTIDFAIGNSEYSSLSWDLSIILEGTEVDFYKEDYADFSLESNQDHITPSVILTRGDTKPIYNVNYETEYISNSPNGTLWSTSSSILYNSYYSNFRNRINPDNVVGNTYSMKTVKENRLFDITFNSWTSGDGNSEGNGGGFSYTRVEIPSWVKSSSVNGGNYGSTSNLNLYFEADNYGGTYNALLIVNTNDPMNERVEIPITLNITGTPLVEYDENSLIDETFYVDTTTYKTFEVANAGSDLLEISNITSNNEIFTIAESVSELQPGEKGFITIAVSPQEEGNQNAIISFETNDTNNAAVEFTISGNTIIKPNAEIIFDPITVNVDEEEVVTKNITILNSKGSNLEWSLRPNFQNELERSLLNINYTNTDLLLDLSNSFIFNYDGGQDNINDGSNDMYDGGNILRTSLSNDIDIPYSDNIILDGSSYFGPGTSYYTRHLEGLFILEASLNGISDFSINGNLGADGGGSVDTLSINTEINGIEYTAYIKRVFGTSDPSVNHVIIVEKDENIVHDYSNNTDDDYHTLEGLENVNNITYCLLAGRSGFYYEDDDLLNFVNRLINTKKEDNNSLYLGINATPIEGSLSEGDSIDIVLEIDPKLIPLFNDSISIELESNDPDEDIIIPISLVGSPKFDISGNLYDYGTNYVDQSYSRTVYITNSGIGDLVISNLSISDTVFKIQEEEDIIIKYGERYPLEVEFLGSEPGNYVAILSFDTNDSNEEEGSVVLIGELQSYAKIDYAVYFENVILSPDMELEGQIAITNLGDQDLRWYYYIYDENNNTVYDPYWTTSIDNGSYQYLSNGYTDVLSLNFSSDGILSLHENYTIRLYTNDQDNSEIDIPFSLLVNSISLESEIEDIYVNQDEVIDNIDLNTIFSHVNDDVLTYNVVSSDESVVSVEVNNNILSYTVHSYGKTIISIAVSDESGNNIYLDYEVNVNGIIQLATAIENYSIYQDFDSINIDLSELFIDNNGDELSLSASTEDDNVVFVSVEEKVLTLSEMELGSAAITIEAKDDYDTLSYTFTFEVKEKLSQQITFESLPEELISTSSLTLSGVSDSDLTVSYSSSDESVATVDGNVLTIISAGSTTITASQEGNDTYFAADSIEQLFVVNKLSQQITFDSLSEQLMSTDTFLLSGVSDSDLTVSYTSSDESVATVDGNVLTILSAGSTTITASQEGNETYSEAENVQQNLVVNKVDQMITFDPLEEKIVGDANFELVGSTNSNLEIEYTSSDESVASVEGNVITILGAGSSIIIAHQKGNNIYHEATSVGQTLNVSKRSQSITFAALDSQLVTVETLDLIGSSDSGLELVYTSSDESVATISGSIVTIVGSGSATITASQSGNATYSEALSVSQELVVEKLTQSITFNSLSTQAVNVASFELDGVSDSGLELVYTSSDESIATIDGSNVTILGVGTAIITATQLGDDTYLAANSVSQVLTIEKVSQVISFEALTSRFVEGEAFTLAGSSNSGLELVYTSSDESVITIVDSTVTIVGVGTAIVMASQPGNDTYLAANSVSQVLTINKLSQEITFSPLVSRLVTDEAFDLAGTSNSGLELVYTSSNESVATIDGSILTIVGAGNVTITASQLGGTNYLAAEAVSQELIVEKLIQSISFDELSNVTTIDGTFELIGTTDSGLEIVYSSSDESVATINGTTVTIIGAGVTTITASQLGNDTYLSADIVSQELLVEDAAVLSIGLEKEIWSLSPNPAVNNFKINSSALGLVQVYSTSGILMKEVEVKRIGQNIEVNGLSSGLYIVLFNNQKSKLIIK